MKQSVSSVWLLGLILIFILIFACYITITVNYSASFKLKNEVLTILQKHHGLTSNKNGNPTTTAKSIVNGQTITTNVGAFETINLYLRGSSYTAQGTCPFNDGKTWYGVSGLYDAANGSTAQIEVADRTKKYYYCICKYDAGANKSKFTSVYYKIRLFYKFEVPVLSEFLSVKVEGMTDEIYDPAQTEVIQINGSSEKFFTRD